MNIAGLQACLASAVRFIQDHAGIEAAPYFDELPENLRVPSMYFPVPRTESHKATLSSWRTDINLECWFIAATDWEAFAIADTVRDSFLADNCAFAILNMDGTETGSRVRISEPSVRKQEDRIVRMAFTIREYFQMTGEEGTTVTNYYYSGLIPSETLYGAWLAATEGQRKDEEEQKQWVKKAVENL